MTSCTRPWPVLFLCCVLSFNSLGTPFAIGAIFTDVMDTFGVSRATASLVQSVCTGFVYGGGILAGHLLQWQGPRVIVLAGSVLATIGCVIAFLATHVVQVIVGIGVISGTGLSFTFLTSQTLPGTMFHDIRSLALGFTTTASAVGSAAYPLLLRHVTNLYSVRGTFLIMAAINCQTILCGALIGLYTPRWKPAAAGKTGTESAAEVEKVTDDGGGELEAVNRVAEDEDKKGGDLREEDERHHLMPAAQTQEPERSEDGGIAVDSREVVFEVEGGENPKLSRGLVPKVQREAAIGVLPAGSQERHSNRDGNFNVDGTRDATAEESADHSTPNHRLLSEEADTKSAALKTGRDAHENVPPSCCSLHKIRRAVSATLEPFRDVRFFTLALVGGTAFLFYPLPWMFMTDMVKSNSLTVEDGSFFITIIFVGNVTARAFSGVLYKLLQSRILIIPSVAMAVGGVASLLFVFCTAYAHFVAVSLLLGLGFGLIGPTFLMSTLELLGPRRFAVGTGYLTFCVGVNFLLAGPYGGLVRDLTNSYEPLYYIATVHGFIIGGLVLFTNLRYPRRS